MNVALTSYIIIGIFFLNLIENVENNNFKAILNSDNEELNFIKQYGGDLPKAILDIMEGFPLAKLEIAFDNDIDVFVLHGIIKNMISSDISLTLFNLTTIELQNKYFSHLSEMLSNYLPLTTLFMCKRKLAEHILIELQANNLIRRNFVLFFYWGHEPISKYFIRSMYEVMKVVVITNPKLNTYRLYYNQATSYQKHHLEMINWWNTDGGLFHHPTLPSARQIFQNFKGKMFNIPVLHKPPWHFVRYGNDSTDVLGGRDDKLLALLAKQLNFKYEYFDPPDRSQGSSVLPNGSFEGVLGLIGQRKAEFFIGDVTLTLERLKVVEFSFLTLADSIAFVTHAPSRLNEALALVRPFHWQVWPAIVATLLGAGPVLYGLVALPNKWQPRFLVKSHSKLFFDCCWFTITLFFKQTGKEPSSSNKTRFFIIILSFSATYIIADMYSANLTSLLAKPGREKSINNLVELEQAMVTRGYQLYVEKHSSSYGLLENGTGLYGRLWNMMTKNQPSYVINSVEEGVQLVSRSSHVAFIAGRETLFFDTQRFGPNHFHLSEKLNTAYSAIALEIGCPYLENFNRILMAIFEAGILTKMTENEYENLEKQQTPINSDRNEDVVSPNKKETRKTTRAIEDNEKLQPISIKMLQGPFYLLFIGHALSGMSLIFELGFTKQSRNFRILRKKLNRKIKKTKTIIHHRFRRITLRIREHIQDMLHEAIIDTLDYTE